KTADIDLTETFVQTELIGGVAVDAQGSAVLVIVEGINATAEGDFQVVGRCEARAQLASGHAQVVTELCAFAVDVVLEGVVTGAAEQLGLAAQWQAVGGCQTFRVDVA